MAVVLLLVGAPLVALLDWTLRRMFGLRVAIFLFFGWLLAFAIAAQRWWWFRCPRCGGPFHGRFLGNPFSRQCANCGFKKWMDPPKGAAG